MRLLAFGINHRTAPVEVREQAAFTAEQLPGALAELRECHAADEAAILSTCNRTELYCGAEDDRDAAINWFCRNRGLEPQTVHAHIYRHEDAHAVKHTFRVAAGLDSMVLGEPQILGQMKDAFAAAHRMGATGKLLNRLFQHTFAVAKQVRTDTAVGASAVSVAYAAVSLARQIFSSLAEQVVLLIGAGETIELTARHLNQQGVRRMIVANRTVERAQVLAAQFGAAAISLGELPERLPEADIVISSTASPLPILGKGAVERALRARRRRPMFMVDLAVPRDIEAEVVELGDVFLYTVDDLKDVVQENLKSRMEAAREAESIIDLQVVNFMDWLRSQEAVPTIRTLRDRSEALSKEELERARHLLAAGHPPEEVIERLAHSLTNKFTHVPTTALRRAARAGDQDLLDLARRLFGLPEE